MCRRAAEERETHLFNALDVVRSEFFQRALKFLVIDVGLSMNDFLLSTSGSLEKQKRSERHERTESRQRTLPPILIALALSLSSFNFFSFS